MRVGFDAQAEMAGFVDCGLQFLQCEFLRLGITAVSEHSAAGENLDVVDSVMCQFADDLPHFPRAVGLAVAHIPRQGDVVRKAGCRASPAGNRHIGTRDEHAGTDDVATIDGVAQSNVDKGTIRTYVPHRSETRFEHGTGIGHRLKRKLRRGLREKVQVLGIVRATSEMRVAVDETGQDGHFGKVDDFGVRRDRYVVAASLDLAGADEDGLAVENGARAWVDQLAGADGGHLGGGGNNQGPAGRRENQMGAHSSGDSLASLGSDHFPSLRTARRGLHSAPCKLCYCGSPTFRTSSANRGSERMGSNEESVLKPSKSSSCSSNAVLSHWKAIAILRQQPPFLVVHLIFLAWISCPSLR